MKHATNATTKHAPKPRMTAHEGPIPFTVSNLEAPPPPPVRSHVEAMIEDVEAVRGNLEADLCQLAHDVSHLGQTGAERDRIEKSIIFLTLQCLREVVGLRSMLRAYEMIEVRRQTETEVSS